MSLTHFLISAVRKVVTKVRTPNLQKRSLNYIDDSNLANEMIYNLLMSSNPCMIARFGSTELDTIINYIGMKSPQLLTCVLGESPKWWWTTHQFDRIRELSGFINPTYDNLIKFSELMINDMKQVDILGSWRQEELLFSKELSKAQKVKLMYLEPFWSEKPWTKALEGKKVLVIHPFAKSIIKQYDKREKIFPQREILPKFASLDVIQSVQSIGGICEYNDWFEALYSMEKQMDKIEYDVCLIGCGAYGFPLAAHAKRTGHKAIHLGGSLQLLFGIAGKRWFAPKNNRLYPIYKDLINENWVYPEVSEKPKGADNVEGGCYW